MGFFCVVGLEIHKVLLRPSALKNLNFELFQVRRIFCKLFFADTRQKRSLYCRIGKAFNDVAAKKRKLKTGSDYFVPAMRDLID